MGLPSPRFLIRADLGVDPRTLMHTHARCSPAAQSHSLHSLHSLRSLRSTHSALSRYDPSGVLVYRKGIFCLESEWFGLRSTVSVRPALELLRSSDYHVAFIHRDVATRAELEHYLRKWFQERHTGFEILWLAMHSRRGLLLPGDMRRPEEKMHIDRLEEILRGKCKGKIVHFGGCRTIAMPPARIRKFLKATGAVAICGFREEVDWTESTLFEMSLLLEFQKHPMTPAGMRAALRVIRRVRPVETKAAGFAMFIRAEQ